MRVSTLMRIDRRRRRRGGAAAVEFALVAPLFLLVLAGIIEFGQAFFIRHSLSSVSRRGARSAIVSGVTTATVAQRVRSQCATVLDVDGSKVTVEIAVNGSTGVNLSQAKQGDEIRLSVEVPFSEVGSGFFASMFSTTVLGSTTILEHE